MAPLSLLWPVNHNPLAPFEDDEDDLLLVHL